MNTLIRRSIVVAATTLALAGASHASIYNQPVAANAYITFGGLEWAWASPVAADGSAYPSSLWGKVDLSFQGALGWRLPTPAEMLNAPLATDFLFAGANVPHGLGAVDPVSGSTFSIYGVQPSGAAACASTYFNNTYNFCNWNNGPGTGSAQELPWWGQPGADLFSDSLVVRAVPEPATCALMAFGLMGLGATARRRRG